MQAVDTLLPGFCRACNLIDFSASYCFVDLDPVDELDFTETLKVEETMINQKWTMIGHEYWLHAGIARNGSLYLSYCMYLFFGWYNQPEML